MHSDMLSPAGPASEPSYHSTGSPADCTPGSEPANQSLLCLHAGAALLMLPAVLLPAGGGQHPLRG